MRSPVNMANAHLRKPQDVYDISVSMISAIQLLIKQPVFSIFIIAH